jgi:4-amino-4-deoxy-L-arabinose transferase-like glycosyltransferase
MARAVLLLLACFGLLLHAHEMITDTALFAGFAVAIHGLTWSVQNPLRAGALLGTGVGIGFMSKGLVEPAMMGLACAALPVVSQVWRNRRYAATLAIAALFAAPWLIAWPMALYAQHPDAFATWFWTNNFGRYAGTANLGADTEPWYYTRVLPWFTFPAGPLALFAVWKTARNRTFFDDSAMLLLSVVAGAMLVVLTTAATARSLYALPLLIPLAILASKGLDNVPQRVIRSASRVFGLLSGAIALGVWGIWAFGIKFGHPPDSSVLLKYLPGDFVFHFQPGFFLLALSCTALWLYAWFSKRWQVTELERWVAGLTMVWGVTMSLCLPWIDRAKSFRDPFSEIAVLVPADACVAGKGIGEPQRGMLHYFAGIATTPPEGSGEPCDYLLIQTNKSREKDPAPPSGWTRIWSGSRPGEEQEHFTLYARSDMDEAPLPDFFPIPDLLSSYAPR